MGLGNDVGKAVKMFGGALLAGIGLGKAVEEGGKRYGNPPPRSEYREQYEPPRYVSDRERVGQAYGVNPNDCNACHTPRRHRGR